jgi:hypothetical protein
MDYLRGVVEIVKAAGYQGLLIVIDEAETILRMRKDSRDKSLNGIRQIVDAAPSYGGLVWLFTGTPEFFDTQRGVAGLPPLYERIKFTRYGSHASRQQPQLELSPFDPTRLLQVAQRLRELYPTPYAERQAERLDDRFLTRLVDEVTTGFRGDVGVVPRQFLRMFVDQLDLVRQEPDYVPAEAFELQLDQLTPEERQRLHGEELPELPDDDDDAGTQVSW